MRTFVLALLVLLLPLPLLAQSTVLTTQERTRILAESLAAAPHCPSVQKLRSVGADVDSLLTNIALNKTIFLEVRLKAVDCLGYFSNKRSRQVLNSMITDPTFDSPFQQAALLSLARAFGEEAFPLLRSYTDNTDAKTRVVAVKALGIIGSARTRSYLMGLAQSETDPMVQQAIAEALK
jgi:HEAT repeat protein